MKSIDATVSNDTNRLDLGFDGVHCTRYCLAFEVAVVNEGVILINEERIVVARVWLALNCGACMGNHFTSRSK